MSDQTEQKPQAQQDLDDLVIATDQGGRQPTSKVIAKFISITAIIWSLFQLWVASPLPFQFNIGIFDSTEIRSLHLAFAVFLAFLVFPSTNAVHDYRPKVDWLKSFIVIAIAVYGYFAIDNLAFEKTNIVFLAIIFGLAILAFPDFHSAPRELIPYIDWIRAVLAALCASYIFLFYEDLANRPNNPNTQDIVVAIVGMVMLLEATRRALGPPLMIIATIFLLYTFLGQYMPGILAWKGASLKAISYHQWISTEGVFGIAVGVSASFVFMFVLFGALLDKAGAGNYFIKVAFALLGHYRGGPAKAAVVASAMTGFISGSSIANVVTTGTFTIPMMKRVGFSSEKAGAVEVASSVNGQIMPPVMGAAAFLMVEYVNISYFEVVKHAFLPALISYIALVYIVHLEAMKKGMEGLPRTTPASPILILLIRVLLGFLLMAVLCGLVYFGLGWIKDYAGESSSWIIAALLLTTYVGLIWHCSKYPDLELDDPNAPIVHLPPVKETVNSGLHFLLPVVVLIWCLMVERLSPGLSAFYATAFLIFETLTQKYLFSLFRGDHALFENLKSGFKDVVAGLEAGARNMIGIGIATATAGVIVGAVSQTGVGLVLADIVELLSGGNILAMLMLTAILSLILGMGLPTTANYIVVSSLLAPVIVTLGQANGLIVPLIAVHLFVFYFGIMADVTPPVGLASFAAAAVSGGAPLRTGFIAFFYSMRTALLPFLFIFNTDLLLIDVPFVEGVLVFMIAVTAMLVFAAATQGYLFDKCKLWEIVALILVAFTLFRPGFWMDRLVAPYSNLAPQEISTAFAEAQPDDVLRLQVDGVNDVGDPMSMTALLTVPEGASGEERLSNVGLAVIERDGKVVIDDVSYESQAQAAGLDWDFVITSVAVPNEQPTKYLFIIPALILLMLVAVLQRRRNPLYQRKA